MVRDVRLTYGSTDAIRGGERRLRWHGRLDAWRRVPVVSDPAGAALTPHIEVLNRQAFEVFAAEWAEMLIDLAEIESCRGRLQRALPALQGALTAAEQRRDVVASVRPGQERHLGEDELGIATVRNRRHREHAGAMVELTAVAVQHRKAVEQAEAELNAVPARLDGRVDHMRQRAAMYGHFTERRMATYWRGFLRAGSRRGHRVWGPLPTPWPRWAREHGVDP